MLSPGVEMCLTNVIQSVPGEKANILGGPSIDHSKRKIVYVHVPYSERFPRWIYSYFTVHSTKEQHAMSSHELQSALMLTVEFLKKYYTR
jgi:hypothetical protein